MHNEQIVIERGGQKLTYGRLCKSHRISIYSLKQAFILLVRLRQQKTLTFMISLHNFTIYIRRLKLKPKGCYKKNFNFN